MLKAAKLDDKKLKHVEAIVLSMTPKERADPDLLNGSRRLRIAKGSGRTVQEVNQLLNAVQADAEVHEDRWGRPGAWGLKLPFGRGPFPG